MRNTVVMVTYLLVLIMTWRGLVDGLVPPCNEGLFSAHVNQVCIHNFSHDMRASGYQERCPWPAVKGPYNTLRQCIQDSANATLCQAWRFVMDGIYLGVHDKYFSACPVPLRDPPLGTLLLLVSPGILFTLLLPLLCLRLNTLNMEMPASWRSD